ncbi:MAG: DUF4197 domain-containing protein [Gammaproteobacteria bacterium]|nr:MAG: DUF4197 domain-containing protein [Gammaproteobacteria bacterium]UCH38863.1 MAG: DUF4197 domain-containing protein [Gammaproteobacteria bacterium]
MRKLLIILLLLAPAGCSEKDLRETLEIIEASAEEVPLTRVEVVQGLKDALARGISRGAVIASARNGYLGNPKLRIPFPEEIGQVESAFRKLGLGSEVDRFVRQLNRSAEKAASRAKPIFIRAITSMTIRDAFEILNGEPDAATRYLIRTTGDDLRAEFRPIVSDKLKETSATRYYGDIVRRYNMLPLVKKVDPDLESYATDKAIEGLFLLIADEEANIRANPRARTTQLLRRVFGSLD